MQLLPKEDANHASGFVLHVPKYHHGTTRARMLFYHKHCLTGSILRAHRLAKAPSANLRSLFRSPPPHCPATSSRDLEQTTFPCSSPDARVHQRVVVLIIAYLYHPPDIRLSCLAPLWHTL